MKIEDVLDDCRFSTISRLLSESCNYADFMIKCMLEGIDFTSEKFTRKVIFTFIATIVYNGIAVNPDVFSSFSMKNECGKYDIRNVMPVRSAMTFLQVLQHVDEFTRCADPDFIADSIVTSFKSLYKDTTFNTLFYSSAYVTVRDKMLSNLVYAVNNICPKAFKDCKVDGMNLLQAIAVVCGIGSKTYLSYVDKSDESSIAYVLKNLMRSTVIAFSASGVDLDEATSSCKSFSDCIGKSILNMMLEAHRIFY